MSKPRTIRKTAEYDHPPEVVWVALTDPRALAEWFMPNDFKPEVGHTFRFMVDPMPMCPGHIECEVLEIDPPRRLVWSNVDVPNKPGKPRPGATIITWTLEPTASGGTRLTLEHSELQHVSLINRLMLRMGWGTMVKRWIPRVAGNVRRADDGTLDFEPGAIPLEKRCYKCKAVPPELVR